MSMADTKEKLYKLLHDEEVKVMALSGKWGSGKSRMWQDMQNKCKDSKDKDPTIKLALCASLFGVTSIAELKQKIAASFLEKKGPWYDGIMRVFKGGKRASLAIPGSNAVWGGLEELIFLTVPARMRNKLIVLDDIERKHESLTIDEVLGFIDDFRQNYKCRFLLILNTDQLTDKTVWEKFREKVIDEEVRLNTTPSEAFDIAAQLTPSLFSDNIKSAVEICGMNNIRIIRKVVSWISIATSKSPARHQL